MDIVTVRLMRPALQALLLATLCFHGMFDPTSRNLRPAFSPLPIADSVINTQLREARAIAASTQLRSEHELVWALRVLRTVGVVDQTRQRAIANITVCLHELDRSRAFAIRSPTDQRWGPRTPFCLPYPLSTPGKLLYHSPITPGPRPSKHPRRTHPPEKVFIS